MLSINYQKKKVSILFFFFLCRRWCNLLSLFAGSQSDIQRNMCFADVNSCCQIAKLDIILSIGEWI